MLVPAKKKSIKKVEDHPFYGSSKKSTRVKAVKKEMVRLRGQGYRV